ncbi:hypothetical protein BDB00DRAFT_874305 [Zychaea mexicana]|uniref:uncharacterized protein n=1 Tax=Zychaea mexicana TaxID=64656 RepID=UPI0022FE7417|nr:uncharacterized protein BDB00DRAFT_874305 [Zychaea mexicana]KAI9491410.1 hypothetical protein BDB00DRAFT_874305 [Zychaea mexicana]
MDKLYSELICPESQFDIPIIRYNDRKCIRHVHEEAIITLTTAAHPAAHEVHQLIDPVALNKESTQDTIDSQYDTEDDADLH